MKKTLIALAAVAATGAAFAQSSVTLYGVADIAIGDDNKAGTTLRAFANGHNNGNSRFGLRGTEDLGGGLKAGFNFEANVNLANGDSAAPVFQRAANMSLSGGFGSITAGRQLNTSFRSVASWELTGAANYSAVATQFGFAGKGSRNDAMIAYKTPTFGGLSAEFGTVLKGNGAPLGSGKGATDLNVIYAAGPVAASLAYNKTQGAKANYAIGGSYDLGVAKVAASYQDPAGAKKGITIGASVPMGPVTLTFDLARATNTADKSTDYVLEAKYALSKRTFVYGAYLNDDSAGNVATVKTWGVGVRHNF